MNEIINALQQVIVTVMALGLLGAGGWFALGRRGWRAVFGKEGWFHRLDLRLTKLEDNDAAVKEDLAKDREVQVQRDTAMNSQFAAVIGEQKAVRADLRTLSSEVQSHAIAIARLQGKEEARLEMAQGIGGVGRIAEALTHQTEEKPHA